MPQVSALASCASRADTPMVPMPVRLALPLSRSLMMFCTSAGGVQSLRENASGTANCSGLYMSQYLPGGLNGWCGSGNDTIRKNGASPSALVEIGAGALAEERRGVKLLRDRGAIGLRHAVVVRQAVLRPEQILGLGIARLEPAVVVGARLVAVRAHQRDMVEAIERRLHMRARLASSMPAFPARISDRRDDRAAPGVSAARRLVKALARRRPLDDRVVAR